VVTSSTGREGALTEPADFGLISCLQIRAGGSADGVGTAGRRGRYCESVDGSARRLRRRETLGATEPWRLSDRGLSALVDRSPPFGRRACTTSRRIRVRMSMKARLHGLCQ